MRVFLVKDDDVEDVEDSTSNLMDADQKTIRLGFLGTAAESSEAKLLREWETVGEIWVHSSSDTA
jgi:hypothetical protein